MGRGSEAGSWDGRPAPDDSLRAFVHTLAQVADEPTRIAWVCDASGVLVYVSTAVDAVASTAARLVGQPVSALIVGGEQLLTGDPNVVWRRVPHQLRSAERGFVLTRGRGGCVRSSDGAVAGYWGVEHMVRFADQQSPTGATGLATAGKGRGVHAFNNLLSAGLASLELAMDQLSRRAVRGGDVMVHLGEVERSVRAAVTHAQRLNGGLGVSTSSETVGQSVADALETVRRALEPLLPGTIELLIERPRTRRALPSVPRLDALLLGAVGALLATMPRGGTVRVSVKAPRLPSDAEVTSQRSAAECVCISVVVEHTEATTRAMGAGAQTAAVDLSRVRDLAASVGVLVTEDLTPGDHASVTFAFTAPRHLRTVRAAGSGAAAVAPRPTQTILVCEDNNAVRSMAVKVLRTAGYRVLDADCATRALGTAAAFDGHIDLLVTDVLMPDMNGRRLAEQLTQRRAGLRTLFISGDAADALAADGPLGDGCEFLEKPFRPRSLVARVRALLDTGAASQF